METPIVTIVVPVYNADDYIEDLFTYFQYQTNSNFKVIFVNDGSTDGSCTKIKNNRIFKTYTDKYMLIDKDNGGVSSARNAGIEKTQTKYIMFMDADDCILENHIEMMVKGMEELSAPDISICNIKHSNDDKEYKIKKNADYQISENPTIVEWLISQGLFNHMCNKIYRLETIKKNNLKLDEKLNIGEDFLFNLNYFKKINKIKMISNTAYIYKVENSQLTKKTRENEYYLRRNNIILLGEYYSSLKYEANLDFYFVKLLYADTVQSIKQSLKLKEIKCRVVRIMREKELQNLSKPNSIIERILFYPVKNNNITLVILLSFGIYIIKKYNIAKWKKGSI